MRISIAKMQQAAFTMVEIALSIAIVAFALVAILGVLPTGMKVQKDNREDTIINLDGTFLLEAIRSGSRGLDDLTNYFETNGITYYVTVNNLAAGTNIPSAQDYYTDDTNTITFSTGSQIIGRLTRPKYLAHPTDSSKTVITKTTARVRALSGSAGEKSTNHWESSFRYLLTSELTPLAVPTNYLSNPAEFAQASSLTNNLYELRLTLSWPLFQRGTDWKTGNSRKTFRTLVSGYLYQTNIYYFVQSGQFRQF